MSATSFNTDRTPTCDEVVSAILSGHPLGQPVSTHSIIMDFREAAPARLDTDEEIIEATVRAATGRTMAVVFDHRGYDEQPSLSWSRTHAAR